MDKLLEITVFIQILQIRTQVVISGGGVFENSLDPDCHVVGIVVRLYPIVTQPVVCPTQGEKEVSDEVVV